MRDLRTSKGLQGVECIAEIARCGIEAGIELFASALAMSSAQQDKESTEDHADEKAKT